MSDTQPSNNLAGATKVQQDAILFAQLVLQLSNTALALMGKVADPESGKTVMDLDAARLFIDQLEMLEAKTKGNLSKEEASLLKQNLMTLRLTFVEAVETAPATSGGRSATAAQATKHPEPGEAATEPAPATTTVAEEEHRKKFSKKY